MAKRRYPLKRTSKKNKPTKPKAKTQAEIDLEDLKVWEQGHAQKIREGLFINEYLKDFNGTRAAKAAGYSQDDGVAATQAWRLLRKEEIQVNINERLRQRMAVQRVDADYVLEALIDNHERCATAVEMKDMEGNPTGVFKFDAKGSNKALELIGRHLELFPTNVKHSNDPENPMPNGGAIVNFYIPDNGRPVNPPKD